MKQSVCREGYCVHVSFKEAMIRFGGCFILRNVSSITSSMIINESKLNIRNISYFT